MTDKHCISHDCKQIIQIKYSKLPECFTVFAIWCKNQVKRKKQRNRRRNVCYSFCIIGILTRYIILMWDSINVGTFKIFSYIDNIEYCYWYFVIEVWMLGYWSDRTIWSRKLVKQSLDFFSPFVCDIFIDIAFLIQKIFTSIPNIQILSVILCLSSASAVNSKVTMNPLKFHLLVPHS